MSLSLKSTQIVHCNMMPNISQGTLKPWSIKCHIHEISEIPFYSATKEQDTHSLSPENLRTLLNAELQSANNKPVKPLLFTSCEPGVMRKGSPLPQANSRLIYPACPNLLLQLPCNVPRDNPQQNMALLARNQGVSLWGSPQNLSYRTGSPI